MNYLNKDLCALCNGKCCKTLPGAAMPEDFGNCEDEIIEKVVVAIDTGKWAIDWWEGDPTGKGSMFEAYYIRPRVKGVKWLRDPSFGGECIFYTDGVGCELSDDDRPSGCKLLEPKEDFECIAHGAGKKEAAIAWLPYREILCIQE